MSTATATSAEQQELPKDFRDLMEATLLLEPEQRLIVLPHLVKVEASIRRRRRILGIVQEALGQLRLDIRYMMFDLDCTREERDDALKGSL